MNAKPGGLRATQTLRNLKDHNIRKYMVTNELTSVVSTYANNCDETN